MKISELNMIQGLNLPTELPCTEAIITRVENFLTDARSLRSRLAADDPFYKRSLAEYNQKIATLEQALEELRQPNFQFETESDTAPVTSVPQVPLVPSDETKNNFPPQNATPTESNVQPQQDASGSEAVPTGFQAVSGGFQPVSSGSQPVPTASEPVPTSAPSVPPKIQSSLTRTASRSTSAFYDRIDVEKKLDAEDIQELVLELEEHKTGRSPLDKLTPELQTAIIALLAERPAWMVRDLLAQPFPTGLGLQTSNTSLNRFRDRYKKRMSKAAEKQRRHELETMVVNNNGDIFKTAIQLLEGRLLKSLANDNTNPDDLQRISRSIATLRRQALAEGDPVTSYAQARAEHNRHNQKGGSEESQNSHDSHASRDTNSATEPQSADHC
jgi:hypothetical protein